MSGAGGQRGSGAALTWLGAFLVLALVMTGCQERLTAPAECPELCPGGSAEVFDTVLNPKPGLDSSATGYVASGGGTALLVSNGLPASEDRAVYRFQARADSIDVGDDTLRSYAVDSVLISLNLVARDTLLDGLKLFLYRISPTVDVNSSFADVNAQMIPANLIDSIAVPDSVNTGLQLSILRGADADRVSLPVGTGGVLAIAVGMSANGPSGVRLAAGTSAATFITYVTVDVPDTASQHRTITQVVAFNNFVTENPLIPDPNLLTVGGEPSSRAFIPFELPQRIHDSATIVRATLELIPATPLLGLPTDPAVLDGRPILADLGPKSPVTDNVAFIAFDTLPTTSSSDTVRLDITSIVQLWQTSNDRPQTVNLKLQPEGSSFTRAVFGSTRSPTVGAPRLRISYMLAFPFENH